MKNTPRWTWAGPAALAGLAVFFVAASWRRWPDPLVDFGRELYTPWRISRGALLYRDVDDIYGPLSQSFNAGLFAVFGPGLMVLVAANLAVFAGILAALHALLRRAWGAAGAFAGCAVFVAVFGFSQFLGIGNYNFAAPYSHEATHGLLVCLLLALVLTRWVERPSAARSAAAGLLLGLTAVLKPEAMLAAAALTAAAFVLNRARRPGAVVDAASQPRFDLPGHAQAGRTRPRALALAAWAGGAAAPTAAFAVFFCTRVPPATAAAYACRAWLAAAGSAGFTRLPLQQVFLGTDHPGHNFAVEAIATGLALLLIGLAAGVGLLADAALSEVEGPARLEGHAVQRPTELSKPRSRRSLRLTLAAALAALLLYLACFQIAWINVGHCLLGLVLLYIVWCGFPWIGQVWKVERDLRARFSLRNSGDHASALREVAPPQGPARLLSAVLAAALMARMFLNGRIYHYGFFEAAVAGAVIPAILIGELPHRLRLGAPGCRAAIAGVVLLLAPGAIKLSWQSLSLLRSKTYPVGTGADRFYAFPPQTLATGDIVRVTSAWLRAKPAGQTAVVLPEGEMINYLARMPSSVAPYAFFGAATREGRERLVVAQLQRHPPDWLVIVSRDMTDSGVRSYGDESGEGLDILTWAADRYRPVFSVGGDPLSPTQAGAVIFGRK